MGIQVILKTKVENNQGIQFSIRFWGYYKKLNKSFDNSKEIFYEKILVIFQKRSPREIQERKSAKAKRKTLIKIESRLSYGQSV